MFRFHHAAGKLHDLLILGGGASTVTALIALNRNIRSKFPDGLATSINIKILERSESAGNGLPYDPALNPPIMRVNNPNSGMIVDLEDKLDFVRWLAANGESLKLKYPDLATIIDDNNNGKDLFAPRMIYGMYLQDRLQREIDNAIQLGIHISVEIGVNIIDAIQDTNQNWYLKTENHVTYAATNLLIAAGHLPSTKFPQLESKPGFYNTPYMDLSAIKDEPVFILGSGLSAIDTAKFLAQKQMRAPIYMISPSGQLPRVKGPLGEKYEMQFMTAANLDKPNLRLANIMQLFTEELKHATGNDAWTTDAIIRKAKQTTTNPLRTLQREISWVEHNRVRHWQRVLAYLWYGPIPLIWKNLDDRDRPEFLRAYFPLFLKWTAGMPLANAKEMAALAEKDQLRFVATSNEVIFNSDTNQFQIKDDNGDLISATTIINATGVGKDIRTNSTLLAMTKRGLIRQEKFRGGVEVSHDMRIVDAGGKKHDNAFAIGNITLGSNIDASSIEMCAYAAKKIAGPLAEKLLQNQMTHFQLPVNSH